MRSRHRSGHLSTLVVLGASLLMPNLARADSMRCGTSMVATGDSLLLVQRRCGEPVRKTQRTALVRSFDWWGNPTLVEKRIEEWTYSRGSYRFDQTLTFENDVLVTVQTGTYGAD